MASTSSTPWRRGNGPDILFGADRDRQLGRRPALRTTGRAGAGQPVGPGARHLRRPVLGLPGATTAGPHPAGGAPRPEAEAPNAQAETSTPGASSIVGSSTTCRKCGGGGTLVA